MGVPILDPQVAAVVARAEAAGAPPIQETPLDEARAAYDRLCAEQFGPVEEMHAVEDRDADGVPVRIYRPVETDALSSALIYFHGGGFVIGSIESHDGICRALARHADCVVVSVEYRLAPEHRFPAPLDDCWQAARWVMDNAAELGIDVDHVGVGGDSAGGCLAAVVARKGRDSGRLFSAQLLLYPTTSSRGDTQSYSLYQTGYLLTRDAMHWYWEQYIGEGVDGSTNPDISPGSVQDLRRLPRTIVVTAEADILRDEGEAYAQRVFLAGVETEGYRYDGMVHGFARMAGVVDRSREALVEIAGSLKVFLEKGWRDQFDPSNTNVTAPEASAPPTPAG